MAITWDDVVAIAPELASVLDTQQTAFLNAVNLQVSDDTWYEEADEGRKYLAAHLATISRKRGQGPTTAQSAGQISQSFANMMQFGALGTTSYGLEYQRLLRLLPDAVFGITTGMEC